MDPFLPGEIPVMVLRYLAANKCEGAALKLIEEMPLLKANIPAKPPSVSNSQYIKHLARSSVTAGLKDLLMDYGNSKILMEEIMENTNASMSFTSESLYSKIEHVQELLKCPSRKEKSPSPPTSLRKANKDTQVPIVTTVERSSNTDEDYKCSRCENKTTTESGCQTEEFTAVQFGLQNDIPIVIYKTLLGDNNLQQKIAQTINEHIIQEDSTGKKEGKISKKAESEIDKFLVELLKDLPDDGSNLPSEIAFHQIGAASLDMGSNITSMFKDAEMLFGEENSNHEAPSANVHFRLQNEPEVLQKSLAASTETPIAHDVHSQSSLSLSSPQTSSSINNVPKDVEPTSTPISKNRSCSQQSVKRITPTPLPSSGPPAVFNSSVLIEKKVIDFGDTSAKCSVKTANIQPSAWQNLNRKSITPKIPTSNSPKVTSVTRVINRSTETVLNLAPEEGKDTNKTKSRSKDPPSHPTTSSTNFSPLICKDKEVDVVKSRQKQNIPTSTHKRKTTPVKLTPEKAKNIDFNFMHVVYNPATQPKQNDNVRNSSTQKCGDQNIGKTPAISSAASALPKDCNIGSTNNPVVLVSEISQPDVTPMQQVLPTQDVSTLKPNSSSNALQRLIASANKLHASTAALANKRKSYSTPRKRKHVRSLTFTTPPSLKGATPGLEEKQGHESESSSRKRKATKDLFSGVTEARSKKRLTWLESEKKFFSQNDCNRIASQITLHANSVSNEKKSPVHKNFHLSSQPVLLNTNSVSDDKNSPDQSNCQLSSQPVLNINAISSEKQPNYQNNYTLPTQTVYITDTVSREHESHPAQNNCNSSSQEVLTVNVISSGETAFPFVTENTTGTNSTPAPPHSSATTGHQESIPIIPFNIVPAPLGFPLPTPIKNFDPNFLNVSSHGFNSPLITPFKTLPPVLEVSETSFALPPTPRMILDPDSNSNTSNSLKLIYDGGMYPINLLSSTPMKFGLPKTPGKESNSSNSRSPVQLDKLEGCQDNERVNPPLPPITEAVSPVPPPPPVNEAVSPVPPSVNEAVSKRIPPPPPVNEAVSKPIPPPPPANEAVSKPIPPPPPANEAVSNPISPPVIEAVSKRIPPPPSVTEAMPKHIALSVTETISKPIPPSVRGRVSKSIPPLVTETTSKCIPTTTLAKDYPSPPSPKSEKSDGEITSSDDEDEQPVTSKSTTKSVFTKEAKLPTTTPIAPVSTSKPQVLVSSSNLPRNTKPQPPRPPPTSHVQPKAPTSFHSNVRRPQQMPEYGFEVKGRRKKLTISEQQTVFSLLAIGSQVPAPPPPQPPKVRHEVIKPVATVSAVPSNPPPKEEIKEKDPLAVLRNRKVSDLIKFVRKRPNFGLESSKTT